MRLLEIPNPIWGEKEASPKYRKGRFRHLSRNKYPLLAAICLTAMAFGVYYYATQEPPPHISCLPDQPVVMVYPDYVPFEEFKDMVDAMENHPLINSNQLDEGNFKYTKGWVVKFNREGLPRVLGSAYFESVARYLQQILLDDANVFVMNLLIAYEPEDESIDEAVGAHIDDTAGILHDDDFFAHQVNVLYLSLPEDFSGGTLEVWPYENIQEETMKSVINPAENTMVAFRGDAVHRIMRFHTDTKEPRVSLVVEQYKIEPEYYKLSQEFCIGDDCYIFND